MTASPAVKAGSAGEPQAATLAEPLVRARMAAIQLVTVASEASAQMPVPERSSVVRLVRAPASVRRRAALAVMPALPERSSVVREARASSCAGSAPVRVLAPVKRLSPRLRLVRFGSEASTAPGTFPVRRLPERSSVVSRSSSASCASTVGASPARLLPGSASPVTRPLVSVTPCQTLEAEKVAAVPAPVGLRSVAVRLPLEGKSALAKPCQTTMVVPSAGLR